MSPIPFVHAKPFEDASASSASVAKCDPVHGAEFIHTRPRVDNVRPKTAWRAKILACAVTSAYPAGMSFRFDGALRARIAGALAGFPHASMPQALLQNAPLKNAPLKHAAVAIVIVASAPDDDEAGFLLTRRATTLRGHAGQWALPGGRCDAGESAIDGALRETHEELGLALAPADVLGTLDDYPTRSGYRITPVVVWAKNADTLIPNADEVASVHRIPLAEIAHPDAVSFVDIAESERRVVRLRIAGNHIHAPTAALLYQFGELLNGRHTRVADLEQPVFAWR